MWKKFYNGDRVEKFINKNGEIKIINKKSRKEKITKGYVKGFGYLATVIDKTDSEYVHRLVYQNFICDIPAGMQVDHINGNRRDNRLENLRMVTKAQNLSTPERGRNIRKAKNKRCFVVIDGQKIEKHSKKTLYNYCKKNFGINILSIFNKNRIIEKYKDRVTEFGYVK